MTKYFLLLICGLAFSACASLNREVPTLSRERLSGTGRPLFEKMTYGKNPMQIKETFGEPFSVGYQGEGDRIYYMAYPIGESKMRAYTIMSSHGIYCYFFQFYAEDNYVLKPGYEGDRHTGQYCEQLKNEQYRFNDSKITVKK